MALLVGLTGGIGSGKTTVAKVFETLGVPVYYADDAAKTLMNVDDDLRKNIITHFGNEVYENGLLKKEILGAIVFNDAEKLKLLNSLVHPATIADADQWYKLQTTPYVIKEAALLFESDAWKNIDYSIGVKAPEALRLQRAMQRDNQTAENIQARMQKQMNEDVKMNRCDFILINDEEQLIIPQILELHEKLLGLSEDSNIRF